MPNLQLKKFDIKSIKDGSVIVFIGKRDTGKSFLVKDMLYYKQDLPIGTVISGTEGANTFYGNIVPGLFIHDEFNPEIVKNVIKRQKQVMVKMNQEKSKCGYSNIDPRAFIILDDCMYDNSWTKDKNIRALFMNGRHYFMMFVITMQFALGIPPNLRTNIDYVFILRENYISNRKRLYEHYAGMFPTFEMFCQVMDQCTEDYCCLVIHNNAKSNKLEEQVFWYKAEDHGNFHIGASQFWEYHTSNYNKSCDTDSDEEFDISSVKKTKGPLITVNKTF
jgi:hypothetical protein